MGVEYIKGKLLEALLEMATDPSPLNLRLAHAYQHRLLMLRTDEFPAKLRFTFDGVRQKLTGVEAEGEEGDLLASARALRPVDAKEVADAIALLYDRIEGEAERENSPQ
jgi:hypothetical protein